MVCRMRKYAPQVIHVLVILGLLGSLFVEIERVYACSCAQPDRPEVSLEGATAVFSGKVTAVARRLSGQRLGFSPDYPFIYRYHDFDSGTKITFETTEIWKGEPYQNIIINTGMGDGDCGLMGGLTAGSEWLVYAYGEQEFLRSNICTRTRPLADAVGDLSVLGAGDTPTISGVNEARPTVVLGWVVGSCMTVIALLAATFLLIKRRHQADVFTGD